MHSLAIIQGASPIEVISISSKEWRVSDPTLIECDGKALLGFVEQVGPRYEVTALCDPRERTSCETFDEALRELVERSEIRRQSEFETPSR
jgi:hypothetical protein